MKFKNSVDNIFYSYNAFILDNIYELNSAKSFKQEESNLEFYFFMLNK